MHALGLEFGSAAQLSKRPGSVWNCLWGNALKRSPGIIRKSRVSYPGPGFLSSATWPLLPKKHYNGLNQTKLKWIHHNHHHEVCNRHEETTIAVVEIKYSIYHYTPQIHDSEGMVFCQKKHYNGLIINQIPL